jgi:pimeloyl-ACP methyl ester carboxylesterase
VNAPTDLVSGEVSAPVRLQSHVWNPSGAGRALLLHGLMSDGATWWRLAAELADAGWMVVAPDLRGHGRSPAGGRHDLATLAGDVAALGAEWDLVVGHSLGGAVAAWLLADHHPIGGAVLIDPVLRLEGAMREELRRRLRADAGGVDPAELARRHPEWDERDVWRKVLATRLTGPDVVDAVLDDNDPWDLTPLGERWLARVHLLAADPAKGATLRMELAERLAEEGPATTYEVVTGCGHSIHRERPEVVDGAVRRVLEGR